MIQRGSLLREQWKKIPRTLLSEDVKGVPAIAAVISLGKAGECSEFSHCSEGVWSAIDFICFWKKFRTVLK